MVSVQGGTHSPSMQVPIYVCVHRYMVGSGEVSTEGEGRKKEEKKEKSNKKKKKERKEDMIDFHAHH